MAQTIPNFNHAYFLNALDTYNYTILTASGDKSIMVKLQSPASANSIVVTIKQNGTTLATGTATSSINEFNLQVFANCAVGDAISIVLTSSVPADAGPNAIKGYITITNGV